MRVREGTILCCRNMSIVKYTWANKISTHTSLSQINSEKQSFLKGDLLPNNPIIFGNSKQFDMTKFVSWTLHWTTRTKKNHSFLSWLFSWNFVSCLSCPHFMFSCLGREKCWTKFYVLFAYRRLVITTRSILLGVPAEFNIESW